MTTDLAPLRTALDLAAATADGLTADDGARPTPCTGWDVATLVEHLRAGTVQAATALGGTVEADADLPAAQAALVDAFSAPGAMERMVTVPLGDVPAEVVLHLRTVEALVHGWDLAVATGRPFTAPADLVEAEVAFSEMALGLLPPGDGPFAPPVPVPGDAAPLDRLVALLGRTPTTVPA